MKVNIFWNISQPTAYVSHLIQHEGKGSLLSSLKKSGFANNLYTLHCLNSAGLNHEGGNGFGFFEIYCFLTENGIGEFWIKVL